MIVHDPTSTSPHTQTAAHAAVSSCVVYTFFREQVYACI